MRPAQGTFIYLVLRGVAVAFVAMACGRCALSESIGSNPRPPGKSRPDGLMKSGSNMSQKVSLVSTVTCGVRGQHLPSAGGAVPGRQPASGVKKKSRNRRGIRRCLWHACIPSSSAYATILCTNCPSPGRVNLSTKPAVNKSLE